MRHCSKYRMGCQGFLLFGEVYIKDSGQPAWRLNGNPAMCTWTAFEMLRYTRAVSLLEMALTGRPG